MTASGTDKADLDVIIIGAGIAGLYAIYRLFAGRA
jgi:cation diffusion facilitator CzcD-associated flavoprotein CzcO